MLKTRLGKDFLRNKWLYLMILPVILYYVLFHYVPLYGTIIAFKQFVPSQGIWGSEWVGFKHFEAFFEYLFFRVIKNTVLLSFFNLLIGFPAPIILALLLNELKSPIFRRITQTITYMPHFITLVVVAGIVRYFTLSDGLINDVIAFLAAPGSHFCNSPSPSAPFISSVRSGSKSAGEQSSIWPPSPVLTSSSMRLPKLTERPRFSRSATLPCPAFCLRL